MKIKLLIIALFLSVCVAKGNAGIFNSSKIESFVITLNTTTLVSSTMSWTRCNWAMAQTTTTAVSGQASYNVQIASSQTSNAAYRWTIEATADPVMIPFNGSVYAIAESTNNLKIQYLIGK